MRVSSNQGICVCGSRCVKNDYGNWYCGFCDVSFPTEKNEGHFGFTFTPNNLAAWQYRTAPGRRWNECSLAEHDELIASGDYLHWEWRPLYAGEIEGIKHA